MKKSKGLKLIIVCGLVAASLAGCGKETNGSRLQGENKVESVINEQIEKEVGSTAKPAEIVTTEETTTEATDGPDKTASESTTESVYDIPTTSEIKPLDIDPATIDYDNVDIDITEMSKDMVYATVYQLVYSPQEYVGKTVKIEGQYFVAYSKDPENTNFYNYCLVADATACCQQGLEFACSDGHDSYPDDFPADETEIEVTGVFEMYEEDGFVYTRLSYAKMDVLDN